MKRRVFLPLLALLLLAPLLLSSCFIVINRPDEETARPAETEPLPPDTTAPPPPVADPVEGKKEEAKARLASMMTRDMNGLSLIVSTSAGRLLGLEEEETTTLSRARYEMMEEIRTKYNVKVLAIEPENGDTLAGIRAAKASGIYYADLFLLPAGEVGSLALSGYLTDLSSAPFLALSADYYRGDAIFSATSGERIFAVSGAAAEDPDRYACLWYDRTLAEARSLSPEGMVDAGTWTLDALLSLVREVRGSGEGAPAALLSRAPISVFAEDLFLSSDLRYSYLREDGQYDIFEPRGRAEEFADRLAALSSGVFAQDGTPLSDAAFLEGNALFCFGRLGDKREFSLREHDLCPLPLPKMDETQTDYVTPPDGALYFCIVSDCANIAESAIFIDALNCRAYGQMREEYLSEFLNYFARNERSVDMAERIADAVSYDRCCVFAPALPELYAGTTEVLAAAAAGESLIYRYNAAFYKALLALRTVTEP